MKNIGNCVLYNDDCLSRMKKLDEHIVDLVICDLPYGTTQCSWDINIPFKDLWKRYKHICKDNCVFVLFGQEPFSSYIRLSNIDYYKYDLYWKKEQPTNIFQLKRRVGKVIETISIFCAGNGTYNPQMIKYTGKKVTTVSKNKNHKQTLVGGTTKFTSYVDKGFRYPTQLLEFNRLPKGKAVHPTQKPVELIEWLVKTYSNENDLVLDNCMGSGTT